MKNSQRMAIVWSLQKLKVRIIIDNHEESVDNVAQIDSLMYDIVTTNDFSKLHEDIIGWNICPHCGAAGSLY